METGKLAVCVFLAIVVTVAVAAEKSESEKIISDAIATMEKKRDQLKDPLEQSRVDKAIRELEDILDDSDSEVQKTAEFDLENLKKKLAGRVVYYPKTGELTLKYDFSGKPQLADFDVGQKRTLVKQKSLMIEAGDSLKHIAKFKTVTVTATMTCASLKQVGIGSSTGAGLSSGGAGLDTIYMSSGSGAPANKIVPENLRHGSIPIIINFMPEKISVRFGKEVLTVPGNRRDDSHQIVFHGGAEGCAFSNVVISGVPDKEWLKQFAASP